MMRTFRAQTKWVFWILVISFVGWLAFSQVMDIVGPGARMVLEVNGREIAAPDFERAVRQAEEQYRARTGATPGTRDERRELEDQVVEQLVQEVLLAREYQRLGIRVRDEEVRAALLSNPPPELMQSTEFQTDGRFDPGKWQRFLATADRQVLLALEQQYRNLIPQIKLQQYLTADVYVSDAKLWRLYRDQHDSVRVALLALLPEQLPDTGVTVTEDELRRYLEDHEDDFRRPAVAYLSYVALDRRLNAADSAAAQARAREVRAEAARSPEAFERLAREVSADSASGARGGDLGWFKRDDPRFAPQFLAAVRGLRPGQVSQPILTELGWEIIRLEEARGDSLRARRIVVPVELAGAHLEEVEARADSLDLLAAGQQNPALLDSAAAKLGLPVARARLREGERLMLGRYLVPNVSVWAFETPVGETSPVFEGEVAYYVFRLDSLQPAGVPPLDAVREAVTAAVRREKKLDLAGRRAREMAEQIARAPSLTEAARALGVPVQTLGPFARVDPPPLLQREPRVLGAAFGLAVGERVGPIRGELGYYFVELLNRKPADSTAWAAQKDAQRASVVAAARQARISQYMNGLRVAADVVDRRQELARQAVQAPPPQPVF
ncbi:MAG TPA: peptidyl-prolyl cis-trans isomerase [Gemmatimonadales bacterium]|nr:peptidyl-prolyl cis-trans isomerase [Gemmatimonadales bacterium]